MKNILGKSSAKWMLSCTGCFKSMKFLFVYLILFSSTSVYSQTLKDSLFSGKLKVDTGKVISLKKQEKSTNPVFEIEANFSEGEEAWIEYLTSSLSDIADAARKNRVPRGTYNIIVRFLVNSNGYLSVDSLKCTPLNVYIEDQCREMFINSRKWNPASQNGKYIKAMKVQPLTLKIR